MSEPSRIGLDNPAFRGRLRVGFERPRSDHLNDRPIYRRPRRLDDQVTARSVSRQSVDAAKSPVWQPAPRGVNLPALRVRAAEAPAPALPLPAALQPFAEPARPKRQRSKVLKRQLVRSPLSNDDTARTGKHRYSRLQLGLIGMACLIAVCGLTVTWQSLQTNHAAAAQINVLSKQADKQVANNQNGSVPSTTKPSSHAISQYAVAADLARYLNIPKLGVHARVLQVGVTTSGALGTPSNVYDTAWYTGSAKPGQPGATLIDGHVSSWTTHGVFYGIKTLKAGDAIQIIRGDGAVLNYQVVKTQVYNADNVDMQAAVTPITAGKSGLNLITCTGQVEKGTSEFNKRVIVFAQQV